jgi:hypothetical protein
VSESAKEKRGDCVSLCLHEWEGLCLPARLNSN